VAKTLQLFNRRVCLLKPGVFALKRSFQKRKANLEQLNASAEGWVDDRLGFAVPE
jgi:hypothetical protein